jgi:hypothetical protein
MGLAQSRELRLESREKGILALPSLMAVSFRSQLSALSPQLSALNSGALP